MPVLQAEAEPAAPIYWNRIGRYLVFIVPSLLLIAVALRLLGWTEIDGQIRGYVTLFCAITFVTFYSKAENQEAPKTYGLRYWIDALKLGLYATLFALLFSFTFALVYNKLW